MIIIDALAWIVANLPAFMIAFYQHLFMSFVSLAIAALIALPTGLAVARAPKTAFLVVNVAGAIRSIPSLAILSAALPILGIGTAPSIVALVVLAVPPLLLNTITGVREVDASILDAANGMGMGRLEILGQIELPLAAPAIITGVRTAAIQVIGGAALASFIGGGGLGDFINTGIAIMDLPRLLVGAIPIALLSICAELGFGRLERALKTRR